MCETDWHPVIENHYCSDSEWGIYDPKPEPPTVTVYPEAFARLVLSHPKNSETRTLVRRGEDGMWREAE